ncbi:MAG: hypothetical protein Q7K57_51100 [Burkholderiaceae bacterium]|nr:hypothetical protein [Burkholderiaceae bacterium]
MRRFIFILMIVLLPLRSWTGEAMATQMASMQLQQTQSSHLNISKITTYLIATKANNTSAAAVFIHEKSTVSKDMPAGMSADCALRMSANAELNPETANEAPDSVCIDCHACHTIALTEPVHILSTPTFNFAFERSAAGYFASADLLPNQKPPIC